MKPFPLKCHCTKWDLRAGGQRLLRLTLGIILPAGPPRPCAEGSLGCRTAPLQASSQGGGPLQGSLCLGSNYPLPGDGTWLN